MGRKAGLGRAEAEVLRHIAERQGPVAVREVADHFAEKRGLTKTTILNVMERLREKGFLAREQAEGVWRYSPARPQAGMLRDLVRDFVDDMLGGSLEPFAAYLAERRRLSPEELARLKETLAGLEAGDQAEGDERDGHDGNDGGR